MLHQPKDVSEQKNMLHAKFKKETAVDVTILCIINNINQFLAKIVDITVRNVRVHMKRIL